MSLYKGSVRPALPSQITNGGLKQDAMNSPWEVSCTTICSSHFKLMWTTLHSLYGKTSCIWMTCKVLWQNVISDLVGIIVGWTFMLMSRDLARNPMPVSYAAWRHRMLIFTQSQVLTVQQGKVVHFVHSAWTKTPEMFEGGRSFDKVITSQSPF